MYNKLFNTHVSFADGLHIIAASDPVIIGTFKARLGTVFLIIFPRTAADIGLSINFAANTGTFVMYACCRNIIGKRTVSAFTDRGIVSLYFACLAAVTDFCDELSAIAVKARFLV